MFAMCVVVPLWPEEITEFFGVIGDCEIGTGSQTEVLWKGKKALLAAELLPSLKDGYIRNIFSFNLLLAVNAAITFSVIWA